MTVSSTTIATMLNANDLVILDDMKDICKRSSSEVVRALCFDVAYRIGISAGARLSDPVMVGEGGDAE